MTAASRKIDRMQVAVETNTVERKTTSHKTEV